MSSSPKMLAVVNSCRECPHYVYYSGGRHHCARVREVVSDASIVASFCPLSDYPSRPLAQMQTTIDGLRETRTRWFGMVFLTHVATRLKLNLHAHGQGLAIPFRDGGEDREVYMGLDSIQGIQVQPFEITFRSGEGIFKLSPDMNQPLLQESVVGTDPQLWRHHKLTV